MVLEFLGSWKASRGKRIRSEPSTGQWSRGMTLITGGGRSHLCVREKRKSNSCDGRKTRRVGVSKSRVS